MTKPYEIFDLTESIKTKSYPYYFCLLTTPRNKQDALALLWGIAAEIRFIPLSVTNPLAGFIRLTAWREHLSSWGMDNLIDWLNTYEIYFDETINLKTHWHQYIESESILLHQSLLLLNPDASPHLKEASKTLGQTLGLIYLMQGEYKFGFANDHAFKKELAISVNSRLETLKNLTNVPRESRSLFALIGYCNNWFRKYAETCHPVTLTEPTIQWAILQQRIKFWWGDKTLNI